MASRYLALWACALLAVAFNVAVFAQQGTSGTVGYEVTRSQTSVPVPHGMVGRKTIDRESRIGNTEETDGNSTDFTMTLGGFMHRCPVPEGTPVRFEVSGDFEYSIVVDGVRTDVVPTERKRYEKHMTARIKVLVNDDLSVSEGEVEGEFSSNIDGVRSGPVRLHRRFRVGEAGTPDIDALIEAVGVTGDMAAAALMWNASITIVDAQRTWREPNACAELEFDPASETRAVSRGESVEVLAKYRTRDGRQPIPKGTWYAAVEQGGKVTESGQVQSDGSFVVSYVARSSGDPRAGDGARIEAISPAGYAREVWRILERTTYEGTFTHVDALDARNFAKVTGHLTWAPEDPNSPSSPTFGAVTSRFFRPSAGSFVIEQQFFNSGIGGPGHCEGTGSRTFQIQQMAPGSLRYMLLEIANDGRYKLTLVIPDRPDPFPTWEMGSTCRFPTGHVTSQRLEVRDVSVVLGKQEGTLNAAQAIVGRLAAPIRTGPREVSGSWSFARPEAPQR